MRIQIDRISSGSLPLVPELPDWRLAKMEGYNGIGKSLTIRLLQICSGYQPYISDRAWQGFRGGLGAVRIRATNLRGSAREIEWNLNPAAWPDRPTDVEGDWFDAVADGQPIDLQEIRQLIRVYRLPGDRGLAETLGDQVLSDQRVFANWQSPLTAEQESPLRAVEDRLALAHDLTGRVDAAALLTARAQFDEVRVALDSARNGLREAVTRQNLLQEAAEVRERLAEVRRAGKGIAVELGKLDRSLEKTQAERSQLAAEVERLEEQATATQQARSKLRAARTRHNRYRGEIDAALERLAELQQLAGLDDLANATTVLGSTREELEELLTRRAAVDAAPLLRDLVDDMRSRLEEAETNGLGRETLFDSESGPLSISESKHLLGRRQQELASVEPSQEGELIRAQIDRLVRRVEALEQIPVQEREVERLQKLIDRAENDLAKLAPAVEDDPTDQLTELRSRQSEADARAQRLGFERSLLARRQDALSSVGSPEDLQKRLAGALERAGIGVRQLAAALERQNQVVASAELSFRDADVHAQAAEREASEQELSLRRVALALRNDPNVAWLRRAAPNGFLPDPDHPIERQLEHLIAVRASVDEAQSRVARVRQQTRAIEGALGNLAARLSGRSETAGAAYVDELTQGYGQEFASWFNNPQVRHALIPRAKEVLNVDLRQGRLEVVWLEDNSEKTRALEAFSRGEQAFAYTRARLASLDTESVAVENRLIVLDEFGAFIARDRLNELTTILSQRTEEHDSDQILLIFPVAANYAAQLKVTADSVERKRLEPIVQQLKERSYFVEQL